MTIFWMKFIRGLSNVNFEGILINVFETQRGLRTAKNMVANQRFRSCMKTQASKRRNSHGDGDFNCYRYFPT